PADVSAAVRHSDLRHRHVHLAWARIRLWTVSHRSARARRAGDLPPNREHPRLPRLYAVRADRSARAGRPVAPLRAARPGATAHVARPADCPRAERPVALRARL